MKSQNECLPRFSTANAINSLCNFRDVCSRIFCNVVLNSWVVLKVERGDLNIERTMASRDQRVLTGLLMVGFIGYILYGQNGALVGAVVGALLGYFWRS